MRLFKELLTVLVFTSSVMGQQFYYTPDFILHIAPEDSNDWFGDSKAFGHFNNDNYEDLVVLATLYHNSSGLKVGKFFLYYGTEQGIDTTSYLEFEGIYPVDESRSDGWSWRGLCLPVTGDFNNDGFDDLAIATPWSQRKGTFWVGRGYALVFLSNVDGSGLKINEYIELLGYSTDGGFGWNMLSSDVNGDKIDDLIVSSVTEDNEEGRIYIYYGNSFFDNSYDKVLSSQGGLLLNCYGTGDINGDGIDDIVGTSGKNLNESKIHIWLGSNNINQYPSYSRTIPFRLPTCVGDLNNDSYADIVIRDAWWEVSDPSPNLTIIKGAKSFNFYNEIEIILNAEEVYASYIIDLNKDGINDIWLSIIDENKNNFFCVLSGDERVYVDVSDTLAKFVDFDPSYGNSVNAVSPADMNGDNIFEFYGISEMFPYKKVIFVYNANPLAEQVPPQITHSAVTTANSNETKTISADLTDNIGIKSATLYYRAGGAATFNSIAMNNTSGDTYEATIPANAVTERGVEYYISAKDNSDNITTYPSSDPAENPQVIQVTNSNFAFASATPAMAYRMISVPFDLDNGSPVNVLEDDLGSYDDTKWRLLRYVNGNNVEYGTSGFANFEPGNGFWLITKESVSLDAGAGKSVTTAQNYTITLQPGWNQIGNPFAFTVKWSDVVKDANVEDKLVGYYGELNEHSGYDYTRTQLEPWQGYFVNNLSNSPITIEIPPKAASGTLAKPLANVLSLYDFQENEWGLQITAECGYYLDKDNYIGCLQEASDTRDHHDFSEAPFFDKHVSLYFPHEDWEAFPGRYTGDFRSIAAEGQFWDFCVRTNNTNAEVTLALADIQNVPVDWAIVLLDKFSNISLNFQQKEKYTFLTGNHETVRNFRIIIGGSQFIDSNDLDVPEIPQTFELSQNYPNPFNPDTQVNYILPAASRVKITIFNLIGEQISVLIDRQQGAGRYSVSWNGTNDGGEPVTSGVYLVRMEAGKFVAVRKMVLAR